MRRAATRFLGQRGVLLAAGFLFVLAVAAALPEVLDLSDPVKIDLQERLAPPGAGHLLGTDHLGRDCLSRLVHGARLSLGLAVLVAGLVVTIGLGLGTAAGYFGGVLDETVMRVVDALLAFPGVVLALAVSGVLGPSLANLVLALVLVGWGGYARIFRGEVLALRETQYVEASRALGSSSSGVIVRHILPGIAGRVAVLLTLDMGGVILSVSAFSFLGLGAQPPTPEWGAMVLEGKAYIDSAPHIILVPTAAILVTVLACNVLGDKLRDALDPTFQGKTASAFGGSWL